MRIKVKVKLNSKKSVFEEVKEGMYVARIKSPPIEGRANEELVSLIAKYFGVPKGRVNVVSGLKSKEKVISIKDK
ncbi:DUF167 domain-containing protein [Patescibacteria group bacterium]|nr:DUF167 domain-containing protein [Patescibacteria group bacterium]